MILLVMKLWVICSVWLHFLYALAQAWVLTYYIS